MDVFGTKPYGDYFRERDPDQDGGVLDGEGYRGTYDGPTFDGHSKVHVWNNNQLLTFEISRLELLRLALGRPVLLAALKRTAAAWRGGTFYQGPPSTELYADVTAREARAALARRAYARVLRGVERLRNRRGSGEWGPYQEYAPAPAPVTAEQVLAPWLMAIIERPPAPSPAPSSDHDERCKDRREMLYALAYMLREGGVRDKVLQTHGWDAELLARVREVVEWIEEDKRQHVQAQAEN